MVGASVFARMCLRITRLLRAPMALAASTYSSWTTLRTSPLTTRATRGQTAKAIANTRFWRPWPSVAIMTSAKSSMGKARNVSTRKTTARSALPPKYPAMTPASQPMVPPTRMALTAMAIE